MREKLEKLKQAGCDIDGALNRCLQDEDFFMECFKQILADENFENLQKALAAHQIEAAFEHAHALKGVLANLGITPLYDIVTRIVEPLRHGQDDGLMPICGELLQKRDEFKNLL